MTTNAGSAAQAHGDAAKLRYTYAVATTDADYAAVLALLRSSNMPESDLAFPTIMARQHGELVGAMGTLIQDDMIIAGPLVLNANRRRPMLAFRLMQAYETAMENIGIRSVILWTEQDGPLAAAIAKATEGRMSPYAVTEGRNWYVWNIADAQRPERLRPDTNMHGRIGDPRRQTLNDVLGRSA
jgi:hypothetical protein